MQIKEEVSIIDFNFISKREITVADEGQVMRLTVITSVEIMSVSNDLKVMTTSLQMKGSKKLDEDVDALMTLLSTDLDLDHRLIKVTKEKEVNKGSITAHRTQEESTRSQEAIVAVLADKILEDSDLIEMGM